MQLFKWCNWILHFCFGCHEPVSRGRTVVPKSTINYTVLVLPKIVQWCHPTLPNNNSFYHAMLLSSMTTTSQFCLPVTLTDCVKMDKHITILFYQVGRQISCSDFRGACFEINFSGRKRGFDGVLYNLWPLANIELSGTQLLATA